ncbi:DNA polymerase alpha, putative [Plasmodium relictum]|uniref:DNA polymerase n=1 Tax=Plasmodium relictum TaxID=85471 RepID=A0A1J1H5A4_PLARL|nr:DNA polymerase alpha, putative [Plasmodium relictum]CRG98603.1 DNA polymerase alpha, putative [Plasmodium relictum]
MSNVFDKIKKQRSKECKATDFYEVRNKNDDIYEVVDEDGYIENKKSLKNFIVGGEKDFDSSDDVIVEDVNYNFLKKKIIEKENKVRRNNSIDGFIREKKIQKTFSSSKLSKEEINKTRNIEKLIEENTTSSESESGNFRKKRKTTDSYDKSYNSKTGSYIKNKNIINNYNEMNDITENKEIKKIGNNIYSFNDNKSNPFDKKEKMTNLFSYSKEIDCDFNLKIKKEENKKEGEGEGKGKGEEEREREIEGEIDKDIIENRKKEIEESDENKDLIKNEDKPQIKSELGNNRSNDLFFQNKKNDDNYKNNKINENDCYNDSIIKEMNISPSFINIDNNLYKEEDKDNEDDDTENNVSTNILKNKYDELIINKENGFVNVYIFDICKHRNSIILFGRTLTKFKKYRSISIYIENLDRYYYFLLNKNKKYRKDGEEINYTNEEYKILIMTDFIEEFKKVREFHNIKVAKYKLVKRRNLNLSTNEEELYVKVLYSYNYDPIDERFQKGDTYSSFYCCNEDIIENFIIKKKFKLPCWVKIKDLKKNFSNNLTYCYFDCITSDKKNIFLIDKITDKKNENKGNEENNSNTSTTNNSIENAPKKIENNVNTFIDLDLNKIFIKVVSLLNEENVHEIFSITSLVDAEGMKYINFLGISSKANKKINNNYNKNYCKVFENEKTLLEAFLQKIKALDIDMYIGYNILNFDLEFLIHRCNVHNINADFLSRKKKLKKNEKMKVNKFNGTNSTGSMYNIIQNIKGRLLLDIYVLCKDSIKLTSYCLDEIIDNVKNKYQEKSRQQQQQKKSNSPNVFKDFLVNNINLINSSNIHFNDAKLILENHLNVYINSQIFCINEIVNICNVLQIIEKTRDLTKLSGYIWMRSLLCYTSERIEFFLLHEYNKKKFITPIIKKKVKKIENSQLKNKNVSKYTGGLVLDPLCGYYDTYVLYLDFNSLYPSIIIEYNVCFSTIRLKSHENKSDIEEKEDENEDENIEIEDFDKSKPGILPSILKNLVDKRTFIKKLITNEKNKEKKELLLIQSLSIKLISNSIYGCLGNTNNRFYAKHIASYITLKGRNLLQLTKFKVEKEFNLKVIYGDTDSIMIDTGIKSNNLNNYKESNRLAHIIKNSINKNYKKLELDLECIFSKLLLLKKKKYACAKVVDSNFEKCEYEMKGINFIKRDFSKISKLIGNEVLKIIFSNKETDVKNSSLPLENDLSEQIHEYLRNVNQRIENDEFDLDYYVITKKLTKNVNEYQEKNSLGHVLVAERMIKDGYNICVNKEIQYCVCRSEDACKFFNKSNEKLSSSQCCFSVSEIKKYDLKIDKEYYIKNQILSPINRLCQYIEGTSAEKLSSCFNIFDVKEIKTDKQIEENYLETNVLSLLNESEERFKDIHLKGYLTCSNCSHNVKPDIFIKYFKCNKCFTYLSIEQIRNYIFSFIHHLCSTFYKQLYICNNCSLKTKRILLKDCKNCPNINCENKKSSLKPLVSKKYINLILEYFLFLLKDNLKKIPDKLVAKDKDEKIHYKQNENGNDVETEMNVRKSYSEENLNKNLNENKNANNNQENEYANDVNVCICIDEGFKTYIFKEDKNKKKTLKIDSYDDICKNKELSLNITKGLRMKYPNISNFILYLNLKSNNFYINYNEERDIIRNSIKNIVQNNTYSQIFFDQVFSVFHLSLSSKIKEL